MLPGQAGAACRGGRGRAPEDVVCGGQCGGLQVPVLVSSPSLAGGPAVTSNRWTVAGGWVSLLWSAHVREAVTCLLTADFPLATLTKHMGMRAARWAPRPSAQQLLGTERSRQAVGWKHILPVRTAVTPNPEPRLMPSARPERPAKGAARPAGSPTAEADAQLCGWPGAPRGGVVLEFRRQSLQ